MQRLWSHDLTALYKSIIIIIVITQAICVVILHCVQSINLAIEIAPLHNGPFYRLEQYDRMTLNDTFHTDWSRLGRHLQITFVNKKAELSQRWPRDAPYTLCVKKRVNFETV